MSSTSPRPLSFQKNEKKVQLELAYRNNSARRTVCSSPFAEKLICGDCVEIYGSKVWHSASKYRRTVWQCNGKLKGNEKCRTHHLCEEDLKKRFLSALSELLSDRVALLEDGSLILNELLDFKKLDAKCDGIIQEQEILSGLAKNWRMKMLHRPFCRKHILTATIH